MVADRSLASVRGPIDTLVMVGGEGVRAAADDDEFVAVIDRLHFSWLATQETVNLGGDQEQTPTDGLHAES